MDNYARMYEIIVTSAFQCERFGVPGADVSRFENLAINFARLRDKKNPDEHEENLQKYAFSCGSVAAYIETAIGVFCKDKQLTEEQKQEVNDISTLLHYATIEQIKEAINRGLSLIHAINKS